MLIAISYTRGGLYEILPDIYGLFCLKCIEVLCTGKEIDLSSPKLPSTIHLS